MSKFDIYCWPWFISTKRSSTRTHKDIRRLSPFCASHKAQLVVGIKISSDYYQKVGEERKKKTSKTKLKNEADKRRTIKKKYIYVRRHRRSNIHIYDVYNFINWYWLCGAVSLVCRRPRTERMNRFAGPFWRPPDSQTMPSNACSSWADDAPHARSGWVERAEHRQRRR